MVIDASAITLSDGTRLNGCSANDLQEMTFIIVCELVTLLHTFESTIAEHDRYGATTTYANSHR